MKHSILIIVLLFLSLMVCACSNNIASDTIDQNNPVTNHEQERVIVTPHDGGERPLLTFASVEEYTDFINSKKLPEDFVTYEKINQLGDFKSLVFLSETRENDYSSYFYNVVDSAGYEIGLYVDHLVTNDIVVSTDTIANVNANDMRTIPEKSYSKFTTDGISYEYVSGELILISWIDQDIRFGMMGSPTFSNYPITQSTFVGKMLNTHVATQAIGEIFPVADK